MFGLNEKGFKRKRYIDVLNSLETRARNFFGEDINLNLYSPIGMFLRVIAWSISVLWQVAEKVYFSAFVDTAEGTSLDHVCKYIGITRLEGVKATGTVTITGDEGAVIEEGFLVSTEDDVVFETIDQYEIDYTGEVDVLVRAIEKGIIGNVPAGTITEIVNPTVGITDVYNFEPTVGGLNVETDNELRLRYTLSVSRAGSSTIDSIRATLLEVSGVVDAIVEENNTMTPIGDIPPKSISPLVLGGDDQDIADSIFTVKAGGIQSFGSELIPVIDSIGNSHIIGFNRPDIIDIDVVIEIEVDSDFPSEGLDLIRHEIVKYIGGTFEGENERGLGLSEDVIYTRVIAVIHNVSGITNITLTLNGGSDNIVIGTREIARTDETRINITIV